MQDSEDCDSTLLPGGFCGPRLGDTAENGAERQGAAGKREWLAEVFRPVSDLEWDAFKDLSPGLILEALADGKRLAREIRECVVRETRILPAIGLTQAEIEADLAARDVALGRQSARAL